MKTNLLLIVLLSFTNVFQFDGQIVWEKKANRMLTGSCLSVTYKNRIYAFSANSEYHIVVEEYNTFSNEWKLKRAKSNSFNKGVYCITAIEDGIYLMGGFWNDMPSNKIEKYDVEKDTFMLLKDMPVSLDCATAIGCNNRIYIMTGIPDNTTTPSNKMYCFDPANNSWTEKEKALVSRSEAQTLLLNGKIYIVGGFNQNGATNTVDIYDPEINQWTKGNKILFPTNKILLGSTVSSNYIYLITGTLQNDDMVAQEVFRYNPEGSIIEKSGDREIVLQGFGMTSIHDSVFIIGGMVGRFPDGVKQNSTFLMKNNVTALSRLDISSKICTYYERTTKNIKINIEGGINKNGFIVTVYNILGIKLLCKPIDKNINMAKISAATLSPGTYIVCMSDNNRKYTFGVKVY